MRGRGKLPKGNMLALWPVKRVLSESAHWRDMASVAIKALLVIAFAACAYLFITEIRRRRRTVRLISWAKENHPKEWNALPWISHNIDRLSGVALLFKRQMISDPHFTAEFMATKPFRQDQNIAFIIGAGALMLVLLAVASGYWHW
jgi:hypothetical protein